MEHTGKIDRCTICGRMDYGPAGSVAHVCHACDVAIGRRPGKVAAKIIDEALAGGKSTTLKKELERDG